MITSLIYLVITIIVVGLVLWLLIFLIDTVPMPEQFSCRAAARTC